MVPYAINKRDVQKTVHKKCSRKKFRIQTFRDFSWEIQALSSSKISYPLLKGFLIFFSLSLCPSRSPSKIQALFRFGGFFKGQFIILTANFIYLTYFSAALIYSWGPHCIFIQMLNYMFWSSSFTPSHQRGNWSLAVSSRSIVASVYRLEFQSCCVSSQDESAWISDARDTPQVAAVPY